MTPPNNPSGMEPRLSKETSPEIERWYQADALYHDAQLWLARGDRTTAHHLLTQAVEFSPDHTQAARILIELEEASPEFLLSLPPHPEISQPAAAPEAQGLIERLGIVLVHLVMLAPATIGIVFATLLETLALQDLNLYQFQRSQVQAYLIVTGVMIGFPSAALTYARLERRSFNIQFFGSFLAGIAGGLFGAVLLPLVLALGMVASIAVAAIRIRDERQ